MLNRIILFLTLLVTAGFAQSRSASTTVPADFPKDIPIYKGAEVSSWNNKPPIPMLVLKSKDSKPNILAFYKKELAAKGWKIDKAFSGSPDAFQATLGSRMISFGTLTQGGTTVIQIGLVPGR
jgi:hypothetical protein